MNILVYCRTDSFYLLYYKEKEKEKEKEKITRPSCIIGYSNIVSIDINISTRGWFRGTSCELIGQSSPR